MNEQRKANAEALATLREVHRRMSAHVGSGWDAEMYAADMRELLPRVAGVISKAEGRKPWTDPRRPKWVLGMLRNWERQGVARSRGLKLCEIHCPGRLQTAAGLRYMRHKHLSKY